MIIFWNTRRKSGGDSGCTDPGIGNVRFGTSYEINFQELVGILDLPVPSDVKAGVIYDHGTEVGTYIPNFAGSNSTAAGLPDVSGALSNYFQQMLFGIITKTTVNFQLVETMEDVYFMGVWQPFSPEQLMMKPEGQRSWSWFTAHTQTCLFLKTDDLINYAPDCTTGTKRFRVMARLDYSKYGYYEYHLVEDYVP